MAEVATYKDDRNEKSASTNAPFPVSASSQYEPVAASQSTQSLGVTGAVGDFLAGILIVPATINPGAVSIKDGSGAAMTIFAGGSTSVSNLAPIPVPIGAISTSGAWQVTTGSNVSAIAFGKFTT